MIIVLVLGCSEKMKTPYDFDWDRIKARSNLKKHDISFERATGIFRDPNLLSIPDVEHSENEERWITMGIDRHGVILVVCHTFEVLEPSQNKIRIITARKATRKEVEKYEEGI